jgi:PleD family two-component response regulator
MSPRAKPPVILVVDDDSETCALLAALLERHGYETRQATSGTECLAVVEREPVTLVLLDVVMPDMDGLAVCRALHASAAGRRLPIVLITGRDGLDVRREGMRHGVCEFLTKPLDSEVLLARVRRQLRVVELTRRLERVKRLLDRNLEAVVRQPAGRFH